MFQHSWMYFCVFIQKSYVSQSISTTAGMKKIMLTAVLMRNWRVAAERTTGSRQQNLRKPRAPVK